KGSRFGTLSDDMVKLADNIDAHAAALRQLTQGVNSDAEGDAVSSDTLGVYQSYFSEDSDNIKMLRSRIATLSSEKGCSPNLAEADSALVAVREGVKKNQLALQKWIDERTSRTPRIN